MALLSVTAAPRAVDLTLLATVKLELGISNSNDDAFIGKLITWASGAISRYCRGPNRTFSRRFLSEGVGSYGKSRLMVSETPVIALTSVSVDGVVLDPAMYTLDNPEAGLIFNPIGWFPTEILGLPAVFAADYSWMPDPPNLTIIKVAYAAGFLLPSDDIQPVANRISAAAADNSFNIVNQKWPLLVPGDIIATSGFSNAANNGSFTVVSATDSKVVVSGGTLVDEAAGAGTISATVSTLPPELERATIETVKGWYFGRDRDWTTKMERIGGTRAGAWTAEYDPASAFPPQAKVLMAPYRRRV